MDRKPLLVVALHFQAVAGAKSANSGYPSFMTNSAWTRKDLNTILGSWTELKHDTLLYAKQVMAEMGGGPPDIVKGLRRA